MPENKLLGGCGGNKDAVCIHTRKVYDACRSRDCLEDIRVLLTAESQAVVDRAINIKPKSASILWTYIDVESVPFNDGFYTVDCKFFYRVTFDAFCGVGRPTEIEGLATFDKRVILYGSEGKARMFSSQMVSGTDEDRQLMPMTNLPIATCEVVDPVLLSVRMCEPCDRFCGSENCGCSCACSDVPDTICGCFRSQFVPGESSRRLYATLGQFCICRLERDTQLLIHSYDYCIPEKECSGNSENDACDMFSRFHFPTSEFFPPDNKESCKS